MTIFQRYESIHLESPKQQILTTSMSNILKIVVFDNELELYNLTSLFSSFFENIQLTDFSCIIHCQGQHDQLNIEHTILYCLNEWKNR